MVLSAKAIQKPDGGFRFISATQLCTVWWAYLRRLIHLRDVQLWFAVNEMVARRCQLKPHQAPAYTVQELQHLLGREGGVKASLQRLKVQGLLVWEHDAITFPDQPLSRFLGSDFAPLLAQIPNYRRLVPVPRRVLRFMAARCGRVMIATILGHLLRCLYYRQGQCNPEGFCKASWIANIFGVSHRNIKAARRHLEQIGLLQRTEVPQWVRNRYGQKMTINLQWNPPTPIPAQADSSVLPPLVRPSTAELPPPDSYEKLPSGAKHQEPAASGTAGSLLTLFTQAREAVRNSTVLPEDPEPVVTPRITPLPQQTLQPISEKRSVSLSTPSLQKIIPEDLKDTARLLCLYDQAVQTSVIGASEADRLAFVGLAEHVLGYQPENPGALFRQLLVHRRFSFITQTEEDAARRRLTRHLYNEKWAAPLQATG